MPAISWEWGSLFLGVFLTVVVGFVLWLIPKIRFKKKEDAKVPKVN